MTTHAQQRVFAHDPDSGLWLPHLQLDLKNPASPLEEALLYHDPQRFGFFSILQQTGTFEKNGQRCPARSQRTFKLSEFPRVLSRLAGQQDVWVAQNEFIKPNRRAASLGRLCLCFVDVDYYKCKVVAWHRPEIVAAALLDYLDKNGIPWPSVIVDSGRGLQVKWVLEPIPAQAKPRWDAVQKTLTQSLVEFGADPQAKDASRVLRLVGTINSRSGKVVRVLYADTTRQYDFDQLADAVLPLKRQDLRDKREARLLAFSQAKPRPRDKQDQRSEATGLQKKSVRQLWQARLDDLRTLASLRDWSSGAPEGLQDLTLWLATCSATWTQPAAWMKKSTELLAQEFAPTWSATERDAVLSTTCDRQLQAERGEVVNFSGVEVDPRYRFKNETIIELLQITLAEQRHMKTLISRGEKLRRAREKKRNSRRKDGVIDRKSYQTNAADRKARALDLREHGKTWAEIAATEGYKSAASARITCSK